MVDVLGTPPQFRYRVTGTKVVDYIGREPRGQLMHEVFPHFQNTMSVVEERVPRWRRGHPTLRDDKNFKMVEQVSLPLARDGKTVDMILNLTVYMNIKGELC